MFMFMAGRWAFKKKNFKSSQQKTFCSVFPAEGDRGHTLILHSLQGRALSRLPHDWHVPPEPKPRCLFVRFLVLRRRWGSMFFLSSLQVKAEASWDSAVHSCPQLSKGTPADERVFLIVRVTVRLSHPADMQLVLRKRICVNVHGRQVSRSS